MRFRHDEPGSSDQWMLEATRAEYRDERLPIERLLDSRGFLRGLSPIHQRRKVWEAWKRLHGLEYVPPVAKVPYSLGPDAVTALDSLQEVTLTRPRKQGDERAREAARLVDQLFESGSCVVRARLLPRLGRTFDGLRTTSLRRQMVDVLGSHLIGMDEDPSCSYTGRKLTQGERVSAAHALRLTRSPHALYYFEKFTENQGRTYHYNPAQGIGNFPTTAVVRESVVRAVGGMLDDLERNTYLSSRTSTWKMREYATDVGKLYRHLAALNPHLGLLNPRSVLSAAGSSGPFGPHRQRAGDRRPRRFPLPWAARREPFPVWRLWFQLAQLEDGRLEQLERLLGELYGLPRVAGHAGSVVGSYVERSEWLTRIARRLDPPAWQRLQHHLRSPDWSWVRQRVPALISEWALCQRAQVRLETPSTDDERSVSWWGVNQLEQLRQLCDVADALQPPVPGTAPPLDRMSPARAVSLAGQIARRCRGVEDATNAGRDEVRRAGRGLPVQARRQARQSVRRRIQEQGGPGLYFHLASRPSQDPNRLLFEAAARLLAAAALGPSTFPPRHVRRSALGWIAYLNCDPQRLAFDMVGLPEETEDPLPEQQWRRYVLLAARTLATGGQEGPQKPGTS